MVQVHYVNTAPASVTNRHILIGVSLLSVLPLVIIIMFRTQLSDNLVQTALLPMVAAGVMLYELVVGIIERKAKNYWLWPFIGAYLVFFVRSILLC